jgi:hypothetical protein
MSLRSMPLEGAAREVVYWGFCFMVQIFRFRCRRCGKTASCPYGWLIPYCRFSAETITAGIEAYARAETAYRAVSGQAGGRRAAAISVPSGVHISNRNAEGRAIRVRKLTVEIIRSAPFRLSIRIADPSSNKNYNFGMQSLFLKLVL